MTPLMLATKKNHKELMKILTVKLKADRAKINIQAMEVYSLCM